MWLLLGQHASRISRDSTFEVTELGDLDLGDYIGGIYSDVEWFWFLLLTCRHLIVLGLFGVAQIVLTYCRDNAC